MILDAAVHWIPLVVVWVLYRGYYQTHWGTWPTINAIGLYVVYVMVVNFTRVYKNDAIWMYGVGGVIGAGLELALLGGDLVPGQSTYDFN
jgi:hypothetical protein